MSWRRRKLCSSTFLHPQGACDHKPEVWLQELKSDVYLPLDTALDGGHTKLLSLQPGHRKTRARATPPHSHSPWKGLALSA